MRIEKIENTFGALSLAVADDILRAAQRHVSTSAPAAALTLVSQAPGMTIDQLSQVLGLSHPGTVRLVDRLVRDDLLKRERSAQDGRAVALTLTAAGEALCQRILSSRQSTLARALATLSTDDRETLGRLVEIMLRSILKDGEHAFEVCRLCDHTVCMECPVEAEIFAREVNDLS